VRVGSGARAGSPWAERYLGPPPNEPSRILTVATPLTRNFRAGWSLWTDEWRHAGLQGTDDVSAPRVLFSVLGMGPSDGCTGMSLTSWRRDLRATRAHGTIAAAQAIPAWACRSEKQAENGFVTQRHITDTGCMVSTRARLSHPGRHRDASSRSLFSIYTCARR
jgi:hypothetical protein